MSTGKKLYRQRNAVIAGVCAGIAERFELDSVVVRILAVMATLVTAGLAGIVYVALWIGVPKAPKRTAPFDVVPRAALSETYGEFDPVAATDDQDARLAAARLAYVMAHGSYVSVGHLPPEPPRVSSSVPPASS